MRNHLNATSPVYSLCSLLIVGILSLLLTACLPGGPAQTKIPFEQMQAKSASDKKILVVVLPGRGDDVANLKASGIAEAIQSSMPDADVVLTGISLAYYMEGRMPQRLHDEIILPARGRGYKEIWLVGASMGGMGSLMYDREYPGDVNGLVLLAPFLGGRDVLKQIDGAGGLDGWQAGPVPAAIDKNNFDRELWRYLQTWQNKNGSRSDDVWLAYGNSDRLSTAMPPLQKLLEPGHVMVRDGGHAWVVWTPAAKEIFTAIAKERARK
jgi:pimeloyl-ACP methyl ester carboxylesterase